MNQGEYSLNLLSRRKDEFSNDKILRFIHPSSKNVKKDEYHGFQPVADFI